MTDLFIDKIISKGDGRCTEFKAILGELERRRRNVSFDSLPAYKDIVNYL